MPVVDVMEKRIDFRVGDHVDAATAATVTTIGSTKWDELLAPKVHRTIATCAGANEYLYLITKP
jgi:hypothetical protein